MMKKYVIIAGVNGAGKSTLYRSIDSLQTMERINIDEIVKEFGSWQNAEDVFKAGKIAISKIAAYFEEGISFNQETTLCGNSIVNNIKKAKSLGYTIEMHYVGVDSVEIAKQRIAHRVSRGGHGIPDEDVERRYQESFRQLVRIKDLCDTVILYDNTVAFTRFAIITDNEISIVSDVPYWFDKYVE